MRCRMTPFFLSLFIAPHAEAGWTPGVHDASSALPATSNLVYHSAADIGAPEFGEALEALAKERGGPSVDLIVLHARMLETDFQHMLFSSLRASDPQLLDAALRSSGNHDNPAMLALRRPFQHAVLDSAVVAHLRKALMAHRLDVATVELEKLTLDTTEQSPRLRCFLWLTVKRSR